MSTTSLIAYIIFPNAHATSSRPMRQTSSSIASRLSSYRGGLVVGMRRSPALSILSCRSSASNSGRGFGPKQTQEPLPSPTGPNPSSNKASKASTVRDGKNRGKGALPRQRKSASQQPDSIASQAPATSSRMDGTSKNALDLQFEERLQAVRRAALDQKKDEGKEIYETIDYDAPIKIESSKTGLGTKIGVGVAVVVFGLVFALGDFLPSGRVNPSNDSAMVKSTLSPEEREKLQTRLQQYEATLKISPNDLVAREGVAVTLTELGEYTRAASMLEDLIKMKPSDPEAFRLLGAVKFEMKDYEGSVSAYKSSAMLLHEMDFEVLHGLTDALVAAKKPDEAVKILLASRDTLKSEKANQVVAGSQIDTPSHMDPLQVELLLGKAYSDWGHVNDAVSVYDQLISSHPDDFRGYLAKGIILKANGKSGDAERMFIQARFFAPEGAKTIVDRYSRQ